MRSLPTLPDYPSGTMYITGIVFWAWYIVLWFIWMFRFLWPLMCSVTSRILEQQPFVTAVTVLKAPALRISLSALIHFIPASSAGNQHKRGPVASMLPGSSAPQVTSVEIALQPSVLMCQHQSQNLSLSPVAWWSPVHGPAHADPTQRHRYQITTFWCSASSNVKSSVIVLSQS